MLDHPAIQGWQQAAFGGDRNETRGRDQLAIGAGQSWQQLGALLLGALGCQQRLEHDFQAVIMQGAFQLSDQRDRRSALVVVVGGVAEVAAVAAIVRHLLDFPSDTNKVELGRARGIAHRPDRDADGRRDRVLAEIEQIVADRFQRGRDQVLEVALAFPGFEHQTDRIDAEARADIGGIQLYPDALVNCMHQPVEATEPELLPVLQNVIEYDPADCRRTRYAAGLPGFSALLVKKLEQRRCSHDPCQPVGQLPCFIRFQNIVHAIVRTCSNASGAGANSAQRLGILIHMQYTVAALL